MKYLCLFTIISLAIAACSKKNAGSPGTPGGSNHTVYIGGTDGATNGGTVIKYWKNDSAVTVSDSSNQGAVCSGIFLADTVMYVAGWEVESGTNAAQFWTNGVATPMTFNYVSGGIGVIGGTVYVVNTSDQAQYPGAGVWTGDLLHYLPEDVINDYIYASGLFVSGQDIYVAGGESEPPVHEYVAKYWKNGVATNLTNDYDAQAWSIWVSGSDVYVCGQDSSRAVYWKNGAETLLSGASATAVAYGICVSGTDVYVCGSIGDTAVYWKNGAETKMTSGSSTAVASAIAISGGDVFAAVTDNNVAKYWNNGTLVSLTDGTHPASATAILVK